MSDNIIEFQQINMAFGKKEILNDVSFAVQKGETLAVIGPSGSGKSTILRLLIGLLEPTGGKILINGQDVSLFDEDHWNSLRQKMGMVFQHFNLFPHKTILENITLAPIKLLKKSKEEAEKIFNGLSLGGQIEAPMGESPWGAYFGMFRDKYGIEWVIEFNPSR